jgi:hypothetical protein
MNIDIDKKYKGYFVFPRQALLLYFELGFDLFGFYLALVTLANWYRGNKNFGKVTKNQEEIAEALRTTQSTVSRKIRDLTKHPHFILRHNKEQILGYFPLFSKDVASKIASNRYETLHELYAAIYEINREVQEKYAYLQDIKPQNRVQNLISSFNSECSSDMEEYGKKE